LKPINNMAKISINHNAGLLIKLMKMAIIPETIKKLVKLLFRCRRCTSTKDRIPIINKKRSGGFDKICQIANSKSNASTTKKKRQGLFISVPPPNGSLLS